MVKRYVCNNCQAERFGYRPSDHERTPAMAPVIAKMVRLYFVVFILAMSPLLFLCRCFKINYITKMTVRILARAGLFALGAQVLIVGKLSRNRPLLMVSNHYNWVDTIILNRIAYGLVIYKEQIEKNGFFSNFIKILGGLPIKQNKMFIKSQCRAIRGHLQRGQNIIMYPEGKTSRGGITSKFFSSLFASVSTPINDKMIDIQPISIRYKSFRHIPCNRFMRNQISWQSSRCFYEHSQMLFHNRSLQVVIHILPVHRIENYYDRSTVAKNIQREIQLAMNLAERSSQIQESGHDLLFKN